MARPEWQDSQLYTFPNDFVYAAFWNASRDFRIINLTPFSTAWAAGWAKIAKSKSTSRKHLLYPGSLDRYNDFKKRSGFSFLQILAQRGADPNFILTIFIRYLWNDRVANTEHNSELIKLQQGQLAAVRKTKDYYLWNFKRPHEQLQKTKDPLKKSMLECVIYLDGGEPSAQAERILNLMEEKLKRKLEAKDFRKPGKRRSPNDKVNRVIFTIYEHLGRNSPRWEPFWDLLVSAGAIKGGGPQSAKDRQLKPHIKSFENDHPKEAAEIRKLRSKPLPL